MTSRSSRSHIARILAEERGNCFLYGCVTLVVLALLGGLAVFLTLRYAMQQVREKYTADAPVELPTVQMAQPDIDALIARVDAYARDLRDDKATAPITLNETEINALLQNHPDLKKTFGDHVHLTLGENAVTAQMSLPLDWAPFFRDRYFNGTGTFDVAFSNGDLQIYLSSASVRGEEVPSEQLRQFRGENIGATWEDDPDARELLRKVESISVTKDAVTVTPKSPAAMPAEPATPAETDQEEPAPAL